VFQVALVEYFQAFGCREGKPDACELLIEGVFEITVVHVGAWL
jgi:hypothetical protein